MPVEQLQGQPADERADQFSFCVSLYEAVYGERPFEGRTVAALMMSLANGTIRTAPRGTKVPAALRRVLLRGLSQQPDERWESMRALLSELERLLRPRRTIAAILGASTALALGGIGLWTQARAESPCTGAAEHLSSIWTDAERQRVQDAIVGTGLPYASDTWIRVEVGLDEYADAWVDKHTEICEATSVGARRLGHYPSRVPDPTKPRIFGPDYLEEVHLRDGRVVRLRLVRPSDRERLREGLQRLSPESRYLRFFTSKDRLTESELRYLTEVDGYDHFAIGASAVDEDGQEGAGLGIGRFVRLTDEPGVAEPALAVVDDAQGQGLGRLLLLRLISAAAEREVRTFRCDFLAINEGMQQLLRDVSDEVEFRRDGSVVSAQFRLPVVSPDEPVERAPDIGPMFEWLKSAAGQVMQLRRTFEEYSEQLRQRWQQLQRQLRRAGPDDRS